MAFEQSFFGLSHEKLDGYNGLIQTDGYSVHMIHITNIGKHQDLNRWSMLHVLLTFDVSSLKHKQNLI
jgi:hypothetical protein